MAVSRLLLGFAALFLSLALIVNGELRYACTQSTTAWSNSNELILCRPDCQWITDRWNTIGHL